MSQTPTDSSNIQIPVINRFFGSSLLFNKGKKQDIIARNLNFVAFVICFADATYLLITKRMTPDFPGIFTCYFPAILCVITDIIFRIKGLSTSMMFTFITVPIAIAIKGVYEPLAGLMLFPFTYGIVSFFLLPTTKLIYPIFLLSVACFTITDLAYHHKFNQHFHENFFLIIFNDLLFAFLLYIVLGYLRNLLVRFRLQNKQKEQELSTRNQKLQKQQEEIANQNNLLRYRNQLLIESWHIQQKITSVLSHETRTSLIFLKQILLSAKRMKKDNPELIELLSELDRETNTLTGNFESVLQWLKQPSDIGNIQKEEINLHDVAEEILASFKLQARNKELCLQNEISCSYSILMNQDYLKVIFRNLLGNAIKFSKKGGFITIRVQETDEWCSISIIDDGIGINAANLKKIGEGIGFTTTGTYREPGTGMGLVFCRDFIEKSAGYMEINSIVDEGTTIIVHLPKQHGDVRNSPLKRQATVIPINRSKNF